MKKLLVIFILSFTSLSTYSQDGLIKFKFKSPQNLYNPLKQIINDGWCDGYRDLDLGEQNTRFEIFELFDRYALKNPKDSLYEYEGVIHLNLDTKDGCFYSIGFIFPTAQGTRKTEEKQSVAYVNINEFITAIEGDTLLTYNKENINLFIDDFRKGVLAKLEPQLTTRLVVKNWNSIHYQSLEFLTKQLADLISHNDISTYLEDSLITKMPRDRKLEINNKIFWRDSINPDFISLKQSVIFYEVPLDSSIEVVTDALKHVLYNLDHSYYNKEFRIKLNNFRLKLSPQSVGLGLKKFRTSGEFLLWMNYDSYRKVIDERSYFNIEVYDAYFKSQFIKDTGMYLFLGNQNWYGSGSHKIYEQPY